MRPVFNGLASSNNYNLLQTCVSTIPELDMKKAFTATTTITKKSWTDFASGRRLAASGTASVATQFTSDGNGNGAATSASNQAVGANPFQDRFDAGGSVSTEDDTTSSGAAVAYSVCSVLA